MQAVQREALHAQKGDAYFGIAWYCAKRLLPFPFRADLHWMGLLEDLQQEVRLSAWESRQHQEELKPASNRAQRTIYRFLVEVGWKRPRGSSHFRREFEEMPEALPFDPAAFRESVKAATVARWSLEAWDEVWAWANSKERRVPVPVAAILEDIE